MTSQYFRSSSLLQQDAERSTRGEPVEGHEPTAHSLRGFRPVGRGNSQARISSLHAMQRTHGNRAVQRYLAGSASSRPNLAAAVQREEEGGLWEYAKKLTGVDQIGPGIEKIAGKAKSGYEWAEKGILDFLGGAGKGAGKGASEPAPGAGSSPGQFEPYLRFEMEDAFISSYSF